MSSTIRDKVLHYFINNYTRSFTIKFLAEELNLEFRQVEKAVGFLMKEKLIESIWNRKIMQYAQYQFTDKQYKKIKKMASGSSQISILMDDEKSNDRAKNKYLKKQKTKSMKKSAEYYILEELWKYDCPIFSTKLISLLPEVYPHHTWEKTIDTMILENKLYLVKLDGGKKIVIHPLKPQNFREKIPIS